MTEPETDRDDRRVLVIAHTGRRRGPRGRTRVLPRADEPASRPRCSRRRRPTSRWTTERRGGRRPTPGAAADCELVIVSAATARSCGPPSWPGARHPAARRQPRPRRLPRRGRARRPRRSPSTRSSTGRYTVEERHDHRRRRVARRTAGARRSHLGAQRGQRREGRPRADARGGRRGRRPAAVALGLRRRRLRHPDRLDRLRLLRRRPGGVARGRGAAAWCRSARTRCSPGRWSSRRARCSPSRCIARTDGAGVLWCDGRRTVDLPPGARVEVRRGASRCGWPGCTRRRSPTGWWPSSTCPVERLARRRRAPTRGTAASAAERTGRIDRRCSRSSRIRSLGVIEEAVLELGPGLHRGHRRDRRRQDDGRHRARPAARRPGRLRRGPHRRPAGPGRGPCSSVDGPGDAASPAVEEAGGERRGRPRCSWPGRSRAEGRSRAFAGGASVPVGGAGRRWPTTLVAVHGQSDQHRLLQPGGAARRARPLRRRRGARPLRAGSPTATPRLRAGRGRARRRASPSARERAQEADLLRFGLDEIEAVDPQPGEDAGARAPRRPGSATPTPCAPPPSRPATALSADDGAPTRSAPCPPPGGLLDGGPRPRPRGGRARRPAGRGRLPALRRGRRPGVVRRRPGDRPGAAGRGLRAPGRAGRADPQVRRDRRRGAGLGRAARPAGCSSSTAPTSRIAELPRARATLRTELGRRRPTLTDEPRRGRRRARRRGHRASSPRWRCRTRG